MRRKAKVDSNHGKIRDALRQCGISVFDASRVGNGFPDLVCALGGVTVLVEVKVPRGKLTRDQEAFKASWGGVIAIVRDLDGVETTARFMRAMAGRLK